MSTASPNPAAAPTTPAELDDPTETNDDSSHVLPNLDVPIPQEGNVYPDFESLRYAINAWALRDKFLSRVHKKDSTRVIYNCRQHASGCEWRVRANVSRDNERDVVVSIVRPTHTCTPGLYLDADGKPKYSKRGVQFTQRWVRDALNRIGFHITIDTDADDIIRVITEQFGETISDQLALKTKASVLVSRGDVPVRKPGRPGRPTRAVIEERQRDMEAAMQLRRAEDRQSREQEDMSAAQDESEVIEGAEARPFVFESGARVIGPMAPNGGAQRPRGRNHSNLDPSLTELTSVSVDQSLVGLSVDRQGAEQPPACETRPCPHCSGTGIVRANASSSRAAAVDEVPEDADLDMLRKMVGLLSEHIESLRKRRIQA